MSSVAGRVYLGNAFSLSMLPLSIGDGATVSIYRVDAESFARELAFHLRTVGVDCAIGHKATAMLVERLLEMYDEGIEEDPVNYGLACERKMIRLELGDLLFVVQPLVRLPEGKILDYEEIESMLREGKLAFYVVHFGGCGDC